MLTRPPGVLAISRHVPIARFGVVSSCRPVAVPIGARTCHGKPSVAIGAAAFKHGSHDLVVRVLAHPLRLLAHPRFVTTTDPPRWHRTERGLFSRRWLRPVPFALAFPITEVPPLVPPYPPEPPVLTRGPEHAAEYEYRESHAKSDTDGHRPPRHGGCSIPLRAW